KNRADAKGTTLWAASNDVIKSIGPGETVDLAIIAGPGDRGADREGKLVAGSRVDLAKSGIDVAVRSGARPTSGTDVERSRQGGAARRQVDRLFQGGRAASISP